MYSTVKPPSFYNVGIYIRLSQEDEDKAHKRESESESVLNQRSLLMNFLRDNGFILMYDKVVFYKPFKIGLNSPLGSCLSAVVILLKINTRNI